MTDKIHWVKIQELPETNHTFYDTKLSPDECNEKFGSLLKKELRVKNEPCKAETWFYEGKEIDLGESIYLSKTALFDTFHNAWSLHESLVLSPDDIWIAVQLQFSRYMNKYAEELRKMFVDFEGKKTLSVDMTSDPKNYPLFMERTIKMMNPLVTEKFSPQFTCSTRIDFNMKNLSIMENMKQYYDYRMHLECGIEKVGMMGTHEDWMKLRQFVNSLKSYESGKEISNTSTSGKRLLTDWVDELLHICDNFIKTYENRDVEEIQSFWNSMLSKRRVYGSGGTSYLKGWLISLIDYKLSPLVENDVKELSSTYFNVPVTHDNNGLETKLNIVGGLTGMLRNGSSKSWRVHYSYVVAANVN